MKRTAEKRLVCKHVWGSVPACCPACTFLADSVADGKGKSSRDWKESRNFESTWNSKTEVMPGILEGNHETPAGSNFVGDSMWSNDPVGVILEKA